jgi:dihydrofolate reductase
MADMADMTSAGGRSRTVYNTAVSADGYIADANGSLDWLQEVPRTAEVDRFSSFLNDVGAFAMGATTYEWVLRNEHVLEHPERWSEWYGDRPCWVFTHRDLPTVPGADVRLVSGSPSAAHEEMAGTAGARAVWIVGGGVRRTVR